MKEGKKESFSLFSTETLDSLAMAEIMGGANNCSGGNCVSQCGCTKTVCDIETNVGAVCGTKTDVKCKPALLADAELLLQLPALELGDHAYIELSEEAIQIH